jgi:hypothetical protein
MLGASRQGSLRDLARRLVWWQDPEAALADERRFLAQAMTDANLSEMTRLREIVGDDALRDVLADPPPGVFDRRSWAYWHVKFGLEPVPPMPARRL